MLPLLLSLLRSLLLALARQSRPAAGAALLLLLVVAALPEVASPADSLLISASSSLSAKGQASRLSCRPPSSSVLWSGASAAVLVPTELVVGSWYRCVLPALSSLLLLLLSLLLLLLVRSSRAAAGRWLALLVLLRGAELGPSAANSSVRSW